MTKGDRDKIRAEIAGRALGGVITAMLSSPELASSYASAAKKAGMSEAAFAAAAAADFGDALMDRLGLSEASELARIQEEALKRREAGNPSLSNPFREGGVS